MKKWISSVKQKLGSFREKKRLNVLLAAAATLLVPLFLLFLSEYAEFMAPGEILPYLFSRFLPMLLGYVPLALLFALLTLASRRPWVAALVLGVANVLLRYANYYKRLYLSTPILASDIKLVSDAVTITSEYPAPFYKHAWAALAITLLIVLLLVPVRVPRFEIKKKELLFRLSGCVVTLALLVSFFAGVVYNERARDALGYFSYPARVSGEYERNTFYSGLFVSSEALFPQKPDEYSKSALEGIKTELDAYDQTGQTQPDIIVVLAESWGFLEELEGVTFSQSLRENYDRLAAESITGQLVSSQRGGGTAQLEFEVLTGLSTDSDILPLNAFNSYTYADMPSVTNFLSRHGYTSYVLHPYNFELYNRQTVYENFGFDYVLDENHFPDAEFYGYFICDDAAVDKVIDIYEGAALGDNRVFIQLITMQNHGPFSADTLSEAQRFVRVESGAETLDETETTILENVASQMYMTDIAIGKLIDYFRDEVERDVIIVVYGDHQANIVPLIDGADNGPDLLTRTGFYETNSEYDATVKTHLTPYLIWSNCQQPSTDSFGYLAPSLLLPYALREFDAVRPAYFDWIYDQSLSSDVKARSGDFVIYNDETIGYPADKAAVESLQRRYILEYEIVFNKNRNFGDSVY